MNILQLAYKSEITGGEQVLLQLCRMLIAEGNTVSAICPEPGPLSETLSGMGVEVEFVKMGKTYDIFAALKIRKILIRRKIDIIHTHGMLVNILGRIAAALTPSTKCVSTVHLTRDLKHSSRVSTFREKFKNSWYYRPLDNFTSRFCAKVVAVSKSVKADLLSQGYKEDCIEVIPNGIDPAPFDAIPQQDVDAAKSVFNLSDDEVSVLVVARLSPQKDIPFFVEVVKESLKSCSNIRAFVAGDGPHRELITQLIEAENLTEKITLLGFRTDVPALLKAADIFALSSRWEGLPISILEAMACSRPIVATAADGTAETLTDGETGFLVTHGQTKAMAEKLCTLVRDSSLRKEMGQKARHEVETNFHVRRVADSHLALYARIGKDERFS